MTPQQDTFFNMSNDREYGFDEFWHLFPRDKRRSGRKAGKMKCLHKWKQMKLYKVKSRVLDALKADIKDIDKGVYALAVNSPDKMAYFPGILPWLNQDKWDREIEPEPPTTPPNPIEPEDPHIPMTAAQKALMLPAWRAIAMRRASAWPKRV